MGFTIKENVSVLTLFSLCGFIASSFAATLVDEVRSSRTFDRKLWDRAVSALASNENDPLLEALLDTPARQGNPGAERRFKLFEIYRKRPSYFVEVARRHWSGSIDCVVDLLVPESGIIGPYEVEKVAATEEKAGKATPALKSFHKRVTEYAGSSVKKRPELNREKCAQSGR